MGITAELVGLCVITNNTKGLKQKSFIVDKFNFLCETI